MLNQNVYQSKSWRNKISINKLLYFLGYHINILLPKPSNFHFLKNFTALLMNICLLVSFRDMSENGFDPIFHP